MEYLAKKLNYLSKQLDENEIGQSGQAYFAYMISYWLREYGINHEIIIQKCEDICGDEEEHHGVEIISENGNYRYQVNVRKDYIQQSSISFATLDDYEQYLKDNDLYSYDLFLQKIIEDNMDKIFKV